MKRGREFSRNVKRYVGRQADGWMDRYIDRYISRTLRGNNLQLVISFYLYIGLRNEEKSFQTGKLLSGMFKGQ